MRDITDCSECRFKESCFQILGFKDVRMVLVPNAFRQRSHCNRPSLLGQWRESPEVLVLLRPDVSVGLFRSLDRFISLVG